MRRVICLMVALLMTVSAQRAAAQSVTFRFGLGGLGTWFARTAAIDARLAEAGRTPIGGPGGGLMIPLDGSIGPVRLALTTELAFRGDDATRGVHAVTAAFQIGARLRRGGWVFLPSMGPTHQQLSLCVKGPAGAAPVPVGPVFDQVLSAAGSGECFKSEANGIRFEIGLDREFWPVTGDGLGPGFFIGARLGLTMPLSSKWIWRDTEIEGPLTSVVTPSIGLVLGVRIGSGDRTPRDHEP